MKQDIFTRCKFNPVLTPDHLPFDADAVMNPGVAEVDGDMVLLMRVVEKRGISQIRVARSKNGVDGWRVAAKPLLEPDLREYPFEEWGCEDARVTQLGPKEWIIAYTAYSRYGPAVALAITSDFHTAERLGIVLSPTNKDAAIFPERFGGLAVILHRPVTGTQEHIWYACAPDGFTNWSQPGVLLPQRNGPWWDGLRVGVGVPPLRTDDGWLMIYHGVKEMGLGLVYRLGLALLCLEDPRKVIARSTDWVFGPEAEYERHGFVPNVVYTCGAIPRGDELWMYYGAADTVIGLATARIPDLLSSVHERNYLHKIAHQKGVFF